MAGNPTSPVDVPIIGDVARAGSAAPPGSLPGPVELTKKLIYNRKKRVAE